MNAYVGRHEVDWHFEKGPLGNGYEEMWTNLP